MTLPNAKPDRLRQLIEHYRAAFENDEDAAALIERRVANVDDPQQYLRDISQSADGSRVFLQAAMLGLSLAMGMRDGLSLKNGD